ncbi:Na(+)/H(+) antiporter subunit B [uncultured Cocleimonas sp.]|uniref:Na(+)/H(+) antiporter subunit B n=1 Tax=uncultured Cocleimonas sp. TaxID=1051587 RepID=UPI002601DC26|nr:Na(+)/H(+) antiporter subunit B [uncultured Cocleimonas sp.]
MSNINLLIDVVLLTMLVLTTIAIVRLDSLFAIVMLTGVFSLLAANIFVVLDAVDVAFTEAAVGAGISTVLMLATIGITGYEQKRRRKISWIAPLTVVMITGAVLVYGTLDMPAFTDPTAPIHQHVAPRFINESPTEVGIPNMVTSVLASYRGYDTMGEVIVVFAALIGVLSLLGIRRNTEEYEYSEPPARPVLQVMSKFLIPFIILFALYVQFHGDFGPGGGFQAGVIFAVAIILYALTFSQQDAMDLVPPKLLKILASLGVLIYGGTGVVSMLKGGNFLDYNVLAHDPIHGQHYGILVIEFGVGLTVACVMMLIFFAFISRGDKNP